MKQLISSYLRTETGAVTVDWVVLTAALVGLGLATMALVANGLGGGAAQINGVLMSDETGYRGRHFGKSPLEDARAVTLTSYRENWVEPRLDTLLNDLSDRQLQNQHATWTARAADPSDRNHARAADQLAMIGIAMDARRVSPR